MAFSKCNETYRKTGNAGVNGPLYEIELAQFFYLRSLVNGRKINEDHHFKLAVNFNEPKGQRFDDVVYCDVSQKKYRMIQAKFSEAANDIRLDELTQKGGDFCLEKYFRSLQQIQAHPPFGKEILLHDVLLFTNKNIQEKIVEEGWVDPLADFQKNDAIFNDRFPDYPLSRPVSFYCLTEKMIDKLRTDLKLQTDNELRGMSIDLLTHDKPIRLSQSPWKDNLEMIARDVIDFTSEPFRFHDAFEKGSLSDPESKRFRDIFFDEFQKRGLSDLASCDLSKKRLSNEQKEYLKGPTNAAKWSWDLNDHELVEFKSHFVLAVNQPNIQELSWVSRNEIQRLYPGAGSHAVGQRKREMRDKFLDWYKGKGETSFLTEKDADRYIPPIDSGVSSDFDFYIDRTFRIKTVPKSVIREGDGVIRRHGEEIGRYCFTEEQFGKLQVSHPQSNIYLLKSKLDSILLKVHGDIQPLREFLEEYSNEDHGEETTTRMMNQDELNLIANKVVIISDKAGMGKTTTLTRQTEILKRNDTNKWIVNVDLNGHDGSLSGNLKKIVKDSDAIEFVAKELLGYNEEELSCFKSAVELGRVVVMLDSFDEISEPDQKITLALIESLAKTNISQLWITIRPQFWNAIEDRFGQFALTMTSFTEEDQVRFLTRYWKNVAPPSGEPQGNMEEFATKLIQLLGRSIRDREKEFTGIPLQCRMLAEAFQSKMNDELPNRIELIELYRLFVEKKWEVYHRKYRSHDTVRKIIQTVATKALQNVALRTFFPEYRGNSDGETRGTDDESDLIQSYRALFVELGITTDKTETPRFIHETFAEYFAARSCVDKLGKKTYKEADVQLFTRLLSEGRLRVMRSFVDRFLHQKERNFPQKLLDYDESNNLDTTNIFQSNKEGFNSLNLATREGNIEITKMLLDYAEKKNVRVDLLFQADKFGRNPLHITAWIGDTIMTKLLLDYSDKKNLNSTLFQPTKNGWNPISLAASKGHMEIMKLLLSYAEKNHFDRNPIFQRNYHGYHALHSATMNGYLEMVELLLAHVQKNNLDSSEIFQPNKDGFNVFHSAARNGHVQIMKLLLDYVDANNLDLRNQIFQRNNDGFNVFHSAARNGHVEIMKLLLDYVDDNDLDRNQIFQRNNDGFNALLSAANKGHVKLIKLLLDYVDKNNVYINHKNISLFQPNKFGTNALLAATFKGDLEIVQLLLDHTKKIMIDNNELFRADDDAGCNPLHYAAEKGNATIAKVLLDYAEKKRINDNNLFQQNKMGCSPLYLAVKTEKVEMITLLLEFADKQKIDNTQLIKGTTYGLSPFHLAKKSGNEEVIKLLNKYCQKLQLD